MKLLVTGAGGQVGRELRRCEWSPDKVVSYCGRTELDITDRRQAAEWIVAPLDAVINTAAYTAVDRAEDDHELARRVNVDGPAILAGRCAELGIPLIHISTDYVFDGARSAPYTEDIETAPVNQYGASKLLGEAAVRARLCQHVILRTASVFSEFGSNFVKSILRLGFERPCLEVVHDQISCPTAAADIAKAIVRIVSQIENGGLQAWGTYHFSGQPPVSWFGFAREIFRIAATLGVTTPELRPVTAAQYAGAARRPAYSAMDCTKIRETFRIEAPFWAEKLPATVAAILRPNNSR